MFDAKIKQLESTLADLKQCKTKFPSSLWENAQLSLFPHPEHKVCAHFFFMPKAGESKDDFKNNCRKFANDYREWNWTRNISTMGEHQHGWWSGVFGLIIIRIEDMDEITPELVAPLKKTSDSDDGWKSGPLFDN